MLRKRFFKNFCESTSLQVKKEQLIPKSIERLNPNIAKLTDNEIKEIQKVGADVIIPSEILNRFENAGLFHEENEIYKNKKPSAYWTNYISRLNLNFEYNEIVRDFFQSIARNDFNFLNLVAEANLANHLQLTLDKIRKKGFYIELESLRNKQEIQPLEGSIYKNLRINRYKNLENLEKLEDLKIKEVFSGVYHAHVEGRDTSIFENTKPYILSALVKVTTPMKLCVFNQNLSLKLYGKEKQENVSYIIKFETELSLSDSLNIFYNPNKKSKLRQTRITDINNVLNGNQYKNPELFEIIQQSKKEQKYV